MQCTNNLASKLCRFTPERTYLIVKEKKRFYGQSHQSKIVMFDKLRCTNQSVTNKQDIHGLLESGFPCTANMVLYVNKM